MCIHILEVADIETLGWNIFGTKLDKKDISHFLMFYGTEGWEVAVEMILDSQCCVSSVL